MQFVSNFIKALVNELIAIIWIKVIEPRTKLFFLSLSERLDLIGRFLDSLREPVLLEEGLDKSGFGLLIGAPFLR